MICVLSGGTGGAKFVDGLRQVFDEADFRKIGSDNARALLPRLRPA